MIDLESREDREVSDNHLKTHTNLVTGDVTLAVMTSHWI